MTAKLNYGVGFILNGPWADLGFRWVAFGANGRTRFGPYTTEEEAERKIDALREAEAR